jgi:hypothetical protein
MRTRVLGAGLVLLALPVVARAQVPLGGEFQVNTFTTSLQGNQSVAADADGNFVVVWMSYLQDGSDAGIFARRYLASGAPVSGTEFRVNAYTAGQQGVPDVASDPTGNLVVVWSSLGQDGSNYGVFGRRYDASGAPGLEFRVNTHTTHFQESPAVAMAADGSFVVVWESYGQDSSNSGGIFAQRYDAAGAPAGGEFRVNSYTTGGQQNVDVAMDATGNFVVVWFSLHDDGSGGIFGQRFDAAGAAQGSEFRVNSYTTGQQYGPSVGMDADGDFVVAWNANRGGADSYGVFAQRYNALGQAQGGEFAVNNLTVGLQGLSSLAMDPGGRFVVTWTDVLRDGDGYGVFARTFDASGTPQGGDFRVNTYTTGTQGVSSVAAADGRFVVTWSSLNQDGDHAGVFGQRFAPDLIFRDDFESANLSAWSGSQTDGGDLSVSSSAAMKFTTAGLQGVVDDNAGLFVEDGTPDDEDLYRARFYFDTNGFDPGESLAHRRTRLFIAFEEAPLRRLLAIVLRRLTGAYSLMGRARLDDNSQHDSGFFPISDGAHFVEVAWKRATGADANDGEFEMWIDGSSVYSTTALDNSASAVDLVRLGALSVKVGASGTLYWDEFESRRLTYIGP